MEKSSKRGKIPQSDWPLIMARYDAGETLASIARTYDCSPPAISYVVSRSRARQPGAESPPKPPSASEPQLIKATASEAAAAVAAKPQVLDAPPATVDPGSRSSAQGQSEEEPSLVRPEAPVANPSGRRDENLAPQANGLAGNGAGERSAHPVSTAPRPAALPLHRPPASPAAAALPNGDPRRTLHLSLGNGSHGNGGTHLAEHPPAERHDFAGDGERFAPPANPGLQHSPAAPDRGRDASGERALSEARSAAYYAPVQRNDADIGHRKDGGGSYIDKDLRARVDGDNAAFLAAFDAALVQDTQESRSGLREATDRLLRAGARTRIELERLEARMPLPPRDNIARSEPAWRHR